MSESEHNDHREWAKHLFEEWKYRHEALWRTTYRYTWYVVILSVLPSGFSKLNELIPGTGSFLHLVQESFVVRLGYLGFIFLLLVAGSYHLSEEHRTLKGLEERMNDLRGTVKPAKPEWAVWWKAMDRRVILWFLAWIVFFSAILTNFFGLTTHEEDYSKTRPGIFHQE